VDQEGGAASFLTAARILKDLGFDRDMTVYFVGSVMEEDCDGLCWISSKKTVSGPIV
jgi:acetylornithine deacetylase/succinyl-diaminopimelate desuccinylase-like protein